MTIKLFPKNLNNFGTYAYLNPSPCSSTYFELKFYNISLSFITLLTLFFRTIATLLISFNANILPLALLFTFHTLPNEPRPIISSNSNKEEVRDSYGFIYRKFTGLLSQILLIINLFLWILREN